MKFSKKQYGSSKIGALGIFFHTLELLFASPLALIPYFGLNSYISSYVPYLGQFYITLFSVPFLNFFEEEVLASKLKYGLFSLYLRLRRFFRSMYFIYKIEIM